MSSSRAVVRIEIGTSVLYDGERWRVASLGSNTVLLKDGARRLRVAVAELVENGVLPVESTDGLGGAADALIALDMLPEEQQTRAVQRAELITLMRTGYRKGTPEHPGEQPDQRFQPGLSRGKREAALADILGLSTRQVRRMCTAYDAYGTVGLADGRLTEVRHPMGQCDPRVRDAILHVLEAQTQGSKINAVNTRHAVRERLEQQHAEAVAQAAAASRDEPQPPVLPAERTFRKYLAELDRGRGRSLAAKQARSIANRPSRSYGRFIAVRPFEVVLVDSSPVDMFCMDITTGKWQRVVITIALDLYTRSIVAWRFTPGDPDRTDACLLLHDMVSPKPLGEDWDPIAAWRYGVPENIVVDPGEHPAAGLPFGWPEQVLVDHGKIFLAHDFTEACRVLGINVQYARPYTPTDKAHVERAFRTIREQFWERLPGYKGPDVWSRGAKEMVEDQAFLFFHELEERFAEWVATGYQNNKHDGLELSSQPGMHLTPNEMFDHGVAVAGFQRLVVEKDLFVELLPTEWRTIQHYGVEIDLVRYNGAALDGFRNRRSPWAAQEGKWRFKSDPRDRSTIYFWRPEDIDDPDSPGEWAVVHRPGANGRVPFTSAELAYAKQMLLAEGRNTRDPEVVGKAIDKIVARTRTLNPATAEERRLSAKALIRDHQAQRDRGEPVPDLHRAVPAQGTATDPTSGPWDRYAGVIDLDRAERASRSTGTSPQAQVDPADIPLLATPEEIEFDPFEDDAATVVAAGYETVGDE